MTIGAAPSCATCKNFLFEKGRRICKAFPALIPDKIWLGDNDHKKPFPGDNGIQFEPEK